jgi:hypothetical protein
VAVAVGVIVAGGGVGVRVGAASGPEVTVAVGSGVVSTAVGTRGLLATNTATIQSRTMAAIVALRP